MRASDATALLAIAIAGCSVRDGSAAPAPPATQPLAPPPGAHPIGAAAVSTAAPSAPSSPTARFIGRVDAESDHAARFAWAGTGIVGRFKGTQVAARLRTEGRDYFQVVVDGEATKVIKAELSPDLYPLATGLPDAVHEVALYKRTEPKVGESIFYGFEAPGGAMLAPPPPRERRIELIGDSITAGYGNEGSGGACTFNPKEENEYATYGALAARELGADHVTIAWSGKTIFEMTEYWDRTLPARPDSRWSSKSWIPQLVVLNVGTNNFATMDPGEARFVRVYTALVRKVRAAYPEALVVGCLGPMLTDRYPEGRNNLTKARRYMKATMAKLATEGVTNLEFLEFPEQNHADGLGCGFHPSLKTHRRMADRLVTLARGKLGW